MSKIAKSIGVARRAVDTLLGVQAGETVLVIADESGVVENREIIEAVVGRSRDVGAETTLFTIEDAPKGVEQVPEIAETAMADADVLIGITRTTAASVIHNEVPEQLQEERGLRRLYMVKRSFEALTSDNVRRADYEEMRELGSRVQEVVEGADTIHITNTAGTDLTASIENATWKQSDFARDGGGMTGIS
jgi:leucyl aminopeptidase (aminopeptidase T)